MKILLIVLSLFCFSPNLQAKQSVDRDKDNEKLLNLFDEFVKQVERIDGDGYLPRQNRKELLNSNIQTLRKELQNAKTKFDVGRVFKRFDAAYPNLHAHISILNIIFS